MFTVEYDGVELDMCAECGGVWLDTGELETILGTGRGGDASAPAKPKGEKLLDCPVCVAKLAKDTYGSTDIVVDRCPHNDGVFLDEGELQAIQEHYAKAGDAGEGAEDKAGQILKNFFSADDSPNATGS